jgi:hypothetical protein
MVNIISNHNSTNKFFGIHQTLKHINDRHTNVVWLLGSRNPNLPHQTIHALLYMKLPRHQTEINKQNVKLNNLFKAKRSLYLF